ncbi:MAG: transglycosylase SLT domain-containing protein, partial [Gammaproteobacteria bacterium]|nr:transglycosylase SLT domain-containing protein [Gammaproteobacteria bacterium]
MLRTLYPHILLSGLPGGRQAVLLVALMVTSGQYGVQAEAREPVGQSLNVVEFETATTIYEPAAADVLQRIRSGYQMPYRDTRSVRQQFDWYVRNPEYLDRVFKRARPYLPYIVSQIEQRAMPMELALLPIVESAFDPFAYSHGQAAGMWQFIPATGKRFGLQQNWWYDGRRDVVESTRAALDYLQRLHQIFDGDWLLAVAAYNSGEGKVRRAIRRAGAGSTFWELRLPRETEAYVPRLLALSHLVMSPSDFGITLPYVADTPYFEIVATGSQIDLALAAAMAAIDLDEIYKLNPGFNHWATSPEGPHRLLVPVLNADLFRQQLAVLPADQRVRWKRYRVRQGDTLSGIAQAHQVTIASLQEANSIRGTSIRAGHHLLVPTASQSISKYTLTADARLKRKVGASEDALRYTVREGDSLWKISRQYDV